VKSDTAEKKKTIPASREADGKNAVGGGEQFQENIGRKNADKRIDNVWKRLRSAEGRDQI